MKKLNLPERYLTRTCTPRQTALCSPVFSRTQRNTHQSLQSFKTELKESAISGTTSRNFISQKSQIFMKIDNKLNEQIKRKLTLQKLNSKMSIISMQRAKFKVTRNKSTNKINLNSSLIHMPSMTQNGSPSQNPIINFQSAVNRRQAGYYPLNSQIQSFRSYLGIILLNHPKRGRQRKSEQFSRLLLQYFISAQEKQIKKDLIQLKSICPQLVKCLSTPSHLLDLNVLRLVDRDISKLVFNICYEVYRKKQKGVTHKQLVKINKEIEYTSRRLKFFELTLRTCFDLGKLYCDQMEYDKAFQQYTHAVKLAIFLGNKYYEQVAIDKLGVCKYYLGDSVSALYFHNNIHYLSSYDTNRIKLEYSNEKEIKRLIQQKKQLKQSSRKLIQQQQNPFKQITLDSPNQLFTEIQRSPTITNQSFEQHIETGQFTFQKQNRNQFYPVLNNTEFKSSLKKIIKIPTLRSKIHVLKRNLKKNDLIGTKRYCGQNYIVPTASVCRKQNQLQRNQVCLSHRSFNRNDIDGHTAKVQKDCKTLVITLNYFINQNFIDKEPLEQIVNENYDS